MAVERTIAAADNDAETVDEPPAPERRPPRDDPGTESVPSRADSRNGAAAANEKPEAVTSDTSSAAAQREVAATPAEATKGSPGEVADDSNTPADVADHRSAEEVTDQPGEEADTTNEPQVPPVSARDAVDEDRDDQPPNDAEKLAPIRADKDRTAQADVSGQTSNVVRRAETRESHEGVQAGSGEQSSRLEGPDDAGSSSDRPVVTDDGAWEWKGLHLTPEQNAIANEAIEARCAAEGRDAGGEYGDHGLTPEMRGVEQELPYGELVADTEKYALKGPDRFKEKLAKRIALEPDKPPAELATEIHDGIRYTFTFPTERYTPGVYEAEGKLRRRGYELRQRKPSSGNSQYKGVNSRWSDPSSGHLFEVQYHTPESWEAKQKTHDAYATIENPEASESDRTAAKKYQQQISASVPIPEGAAEIPEYKDEGR
jgi:hypothetical protein